MSTNTIRPVDAGILALQSHPHEETASQAPPAPLAEATLLVDDSWQMARKVRYNKTAIKNLVLSADVLVQIVLCRDATGEDSCLIRPEALLGIVQKIHKFIDSEICRIRISHVFLGWWYSRKLAKYQAEIEGHLRSSTHFPTIQKALERIEDNYAENLRILLPTPQPPTSNSHGKNPRHASTSPVSDFSADQPPPQFEGYQNASHQVPLTPPRPAPARQTIITGDYVVNNNSHSVTSHNSGNQINISTSNSNNRYTHGRGVGLAFGLSNQTWASQRAY